jgi:hypothetical protein
LSKRVGPWSNFKKSWLLRLAQALEVSVAAMDPNVRGVFLGLLVIIIACGAIYAGGYVWPK